ncbi:hypothetical protein L211DRAFT_361139 [Terfezia boudieri ATCC MYA-4762]|uniref:Uncharacterized protein n=1 Tax=Terfezia boudieri ATCC MYA-4762 TaxID=1051890 RepID=A0A3N4LL18_9PEZI|nr:hypothetical protein L211DRAFT_361139 [Terfezia boudieri ATCC MYA-4762]
MVILPMTDQTFFWPHWKVNAVCVYIPTSIVTPQILIAVHFHCRVTREATHGMV